MRYSGTIQCPSKPKPSLRVTIGLSGQLCLTHARIFNAVWDDQPSSEMRLYGKAVLEESVLDSLISDLRAHSDDGVVGATAGASELGV